MVILCFIKQKQIMEICILERIRYWKRKSNTNSIIACFFFFQGAKKVLHHKEIKLFPLMSLKPEGAKYTTIIIFPFALFFLYSSFCFSHPCAICIQNILVIHFVFLCVPFLQPLNDVDLFFVILCECVYISKAGDEKSFSSGT